MIDVFWESALAAAVPDSGSVDSSGTAPPAGMFGLPGGCHNGGMVGAVVASPHRIYYKPFKVIAPIAVSNARINVSVIEATTADRATWVGVGRLDGNMNPVADSIVEVLTFAGVVGNQSLVLAADLNPGVWATFLVAKGNPSFASYPIGNPGFTYENVGAVGDCFYRDYPGIGSVGMTNPGFPISTYTGILAVPPMVLLDWT